MRQTAIRCAQHHSLRLRAIAVICPVHEQSLGSDIAATRDSQIKAWRRQLNLGRETYVPALQKKLQLHMGIASEMYAPKSGVSRALPGAHSWHCRSRGVDPHADLTLGNDEACNGDLAVMLAGLEQMGVDQKG